MDVQAYINTGIIERYVLGETSLEEDKEISYLKGKYPVIQKEIDDVELALEKYSMARGINPSAKAKANLLDKVDVDTNEQLMKDKLEKRKNLLNQKINKLK